MPKPRFVLAPPEDKRFSETFFLVEATDFEKFSLWKEWKDKVAWEDDMRGCMGQIGTVARRPITLSVFWARIEGKLVAFWEVTSQLADYEMAEKWLKENCDPPKVDGGTRPARCNAMNFHLCAHSIQRANANEPVGTPA